MMRSIVSLYMPLLFNTSSFCINGNQDSTTCWQRKGEQFRISIIIIYLFILLGSWAIQN
jgi:hypothetical protein